MKTYNREHYAEQRMWAKQHPERIQEARKRFNEKHPSYHRNKREEHKQRITLYNHKWNAKNKEKKKAERQTSQEPLLESCEICESVENLLHHHPDYSEPAIFVTLCSRCHKHVHNLVVKK